MRSIMIAIVAAGCAHARTPEAYRLDVQAALATKASDMKACYDTALQQEPTAAGRVTVKFAVEKDTGRITNPSVVAAQTTAPASLATCVMGMLPAVSISPGDAKQGDATWSWDFQVGAAPAAAPVK